MALVKRLSNIETEDSMKRVNCFRAVFPKNVLSKKINERCEKLRNDNLPGNGSDCVCNYNHYKKKYIEFFESFGMPKAKEILRFTSRIQDVLSIYYLLDTDTFALIISKIDYVVYLNMLVFINIL